MQATITYLLTEQAQRAQMAATGQPVARKQTMTIDIATEDLALFPVHEDGTISVDLTGYNGKWHNELAAAGWGPWNGGTGAAAITITPLLVQDLRRGMAILAEAQAAKDALAAQNGEHNRAITEAAYRAFLDDPAARQSLYHDPRVQDLRSPADFYPQQHAEFVTEIRHRNDADTASKKLADAAREQAKTDYIAAWIAEHADESTRAQFGDGLLCRSVALSMIADAAFAAAGVPEAAEYDDDFCRNNDCPCGSKDLDCLPRSVYPAWQKIKAGLPEGCTVSFSRVRECLCSALERGEISPDEAETAGPAIYLAEIRMPHGPFVFERTVRLEK